MADVKEEVSESSTDTKEVVDERGVPYQNRIRELERKLKEAEERLRLSEEPESDPEPEKAPSGGFSNDLNELVRNPKEYIQKALAEQRFQEEIPEAQKWLNAQTGYTSADDAELVRIMRESGLQTSSLFPLKRAQTAWRILKAERLEQEKNTSKNDDVRTSKIRSTSPEGSGRVVPVKTGPSREEAMKNLEQATTDGRIDDAVYWNEYLESLAWERQSKK